MEYTLASHPVLKRPAIFNNLPGKVINDIHQDHEGLIWIASNNGLIKYDGYTIESYFPKINNSTSISDNVIIDIFHDSHNQLWIGTRNGLNRYNRLNNNFERYFHDPKNPQSLSHSVIYNIFEDSSHRLWISTHKGLNQFHKNSNSFSSYQITNNTLKNNNDFANPVFTIHQSEDCCLWLGTNEGLHRFDISNNTTHNTVFGPLNNSRYNPNRVYRIASANQNYLWLGTRQGLIKFNTKTNDFQIIDKLSSISINNILPINKNQLAIATEFNGIIFFNPENHNTQTINANKDDQYGLLSKLILSLYQDNTGLLWAGTFNGINQIYLDSAYENIRRLPGNINSLLSHRIEKIFIDSHNDLWVASGNGTTKISNWESGKAAIKHYQPFGDNSTAYDIYEDSLNKIWLSTSTNLYIYDQQTDSFSPASSTLSFIDEHFLRQTLEVIGDESAQHLWIATKRFGMLQINLKQQTVTVINEKNYGLSSNEMITIYRDSKEKIWAGTYAGLNYYDPSTDKLINIRHENSKHLFNKALITDITEDNAENIWVSTEIGLFKILTNNKKPVYTPFFTEKPNLAISSMSKSANQLWLGTGNGLIQFNIESEDFTPIDHHFAFKKDTFYTNDSLTTPSGKILFSSRDGILILNPKNIKQASNNQQTQITKIIINNKPILLNSPYLQQNNKDIKTITLGYNDNMLGLEFSLTDYIKPELNQYSYKLQGLDNEWITTNANNRRAVYTTLPSGNYTFSVKGKRGNGKWSDKVTKINIAVLPPPWKTHWAYALYLLLLIIIIFLIVKFRTSTLILRTEKLESIINARTQEIQELLDKKNQLFANVSHELRTPLTLILGPVKRLIKNNSPHNDVDTLQVIKRNSQRLLKMVDQLLEISKLSYSKEQTKEIYSLSTISKFIFSSIQSLAAEKNLHFTSQINNNIHVQTIPQALETILINLLTNAIKYTPEHGSVSMTINHTDKMALITVTDTGIGIDKEHQGKIFEKFIRLENQFDSGIPGAGIGLALVKELVEIHQGSISVESHKAQGSSFCVQLPLYKGNVKHTNINTLTDYHLDETKYLKENIKTSDRKPNKPISAEFQELSTRKAQSILIIEDTADMRCYLGSIISDHFSVYSAENGHTGLQKAIELQPDLILCDVMMPDIDGFQVLESIRDNPQTSHIPMIMLTAKGDKASRLKGLSNLANDYIAKPFDSDELLIRIHNILSIRKLQTQHIAVELQKNMPFVPPDTGLLTPKDTDFLHKFQAFIQKNFYQCNLSIEDIATGLHTSERSLQAKIKSLIGHGPKEYLIIFRLNRAAEYLTNSDSSINSIAEKTGFADQAYFSRSFKAHFGCAPSKYRKRRQ